jgi:TraX protein
VSEVGRQASVLPPIRLSDGTVEGLKWAALVLMTLDHIDKYLLNAQVALLFALGRLALPLFGVVLAFNLARPEALEQGVYLRVLSRLAITAAISEIPFIALGGLAWGWYPFNILVTLIVSVSIMWLLDLGGAWRTTLAVLVFLVGGALVEFWWPGVAMCVAAWSYCRRPGAWALLWWVTATAGLYLINRNLWALMALPLIFYAPHARWRIPRIRYAFYTYYPAHLAVIWSLSPTTAGP